MMKNYFFTFEDSRILIRCNRAKFFAIAALMMVIPTAMLIFLRNAHPFLNLNVWSGWAFLGLALISPVIITIRTLREKDMEIIRHSDTTFDLNGKQLILDKKVDYLDVVESKGKSSSTFSISLKYADERIRLCRILSRDEKEEYIYPLADFFKLPFRD